jgi:AcrR family transcriptional regulator
MSDQEPQPEQKSPGIEGRGRRTSQRKVRSDAKVSRKALLTAARELFAESGQDALTIVEVAKRAGLNRSTAYQHFRSREELSHAVAEDFALELREMLNEPRGFGEQVDFFVHYFQAHPDIARLWMFHLLSGESRPREGWGDYIESLEQIAKSPNSLPGIDAEMLGVIGLTSALVWSVMAQSQTNTPTTTPTTTQNNNKTTSTETDRFAAELKRLFLAGTRSSEHVKEAPVGETAPTHQIKRTEK